MFSFGIDPSITSTYGASSWPRAAARNGFRNSSPPSDGSSTLLCRCTFGRPGISPSTTSSIEGSVPAVIDTVSPSQLMPSEIHRMWTSSTPVAVLVPTSLPPPGNHRFVVHDLERLDQQLLARDDLHLRPTARAADERKPLGRGLGRALAAREPHRHLLDHELGALDHGALGDKAERERQRVRHDLPERAHLQLDPLDAAAASVLLADRDHGLRDRELVHQQILGSGSPTS